MHLFKKISTVTLLATCVAMQAQSGTDQALAKPAKTRAAKVKAKTQEEILLEQLNEKFEKLDRLSEPYHRVEDLE